MRRSPGVKGNDAQKSELTEPEASLIETNQCLRMQVVGLLLEIAELREKQPGPFA